jgi:phosphate/sulfate permease
MIQNILIAISVVFFAMNMGASGIAPSFAAVYGGKLIKRKQALVFFSIFVIIGAVLLGRNVSLTLGKGLLPGEVLGPNTALIIIAAAALSLFLANLLKVPQSTSQVTVGSIVGAGLYFRQIKLNTLLLKILPAWVLLPAASFLFTFLLYRKVYPPKHNNLHIYEKLFAHEQKLKASALAVSCYVAFAIGSNNVANAVGPLFGAGVIGLLPGLLLISPLFGAGAFTLGRGPLETAGKEIVPLGVFSSTLVSFITATLLIAASLMGIPQSLVQLNILSLFAISCLKNGHKSTIGLHITKKTLVIWMVTPLLAMGISYLLFFLQAKYL